MSNCLFDNDTVILVFKYIHASCAVYGPLTKDDIIAIMETYHKEKVSKSLDKFIYTLLEEEVKKKNIQCINGYYAHFFYDGWEELIQTSDDIEKKQWNSEDDLLRFYTNINIDAFTPSFELHKFIQSLKVSDKERIEAIISTFAIQAMDVKELDDLLEKEDVDLSMEESSQLYTIFTNFVREYPRFTLWGYSINEVETLPAFEKLREDMKENFHLNYFNGTMEHYSYQDCIALATAFLQEKVYEQFNSDLKLVFRVNNKKYIASILGHYGKEIGLVMYRSMEEYTHMDDLYCDHLEDYPDIYYRYSCVKMVCDETELFQNDRVLDECQKMNYPTTPIFLAMNLGEQTRIVNEEETEILGSILNQLLYVTRNNARDDIDFFYGQDNDPDLLYPFYDDTNAGNMEEIEDSRNLYEEMYFKPVPSQVIKQIKGLEPFNLDIGFYYMDFRDTEKMPFMCLMRDSNKNRLLSPIMEQSSSLENLYQMISNSLIQYGGIPISVSFVNRGTLEMLAPFFQSLGKTIFHLNSSLNSVFEDMMKMAVIDDNEKMVS